MDSQVASESTIVQQLVGAFSRRRRPIPKVLCPSVSQSVSQFSIARTRFPFVPKEPFSDSVSHVDSLSIFLFLMWRRFGLEMCDQNLLVEKVRVAKRHCTSNCHKSNAFSDCQCRRLHCIGSCCTNGFNTFPGCSSSGSFDWKNGKKWELEFSEIMLPFCRTQTKSRCATKSRCSTTTFSCPTIRCLPLLWFVSKLWQWIVCLLLCDF